MSTSVEIVICGQLPPDWSEVLEGLDLVSRPDGNTVITGILPDQAALYGLLMALRDWGLTLISVNRMSQKRMGTDEKSL